MQLPNSAEKAQKLYDEITGIWNDLSSKLDAMSNYHFTPKPVVDDIQIKSNVSSIQMEEVLPMGVSVQSRLAPEEVFKKKRGREGVLIGEDELNKERTIWIKNKLYTYAEIYNLKLE